MRSTATSALLALSILSFVQTAPADGVYDGVWIGTETVTVAPIGTRSEETFSIIFQQDANTLHAMAQDLSSVEDTATLTLRRAGSNWTL